MSRPLLCIAGAVPPAGRGGSIVIGATWVQGIEAATNHVLSLSLSALPSYFNCSFIVLLIF